jgi:hypothetical protein
VFESLYYLNRRLWDKNSELQDNTQPPKLVLSEEIHALRHSFKRSGNYFYMVTQSSIPAKIHLCILLDEYPFKHHWSFCITFTVFTLLRNKLYGHVPQSDSRRLKWISSIVMPPRTAVIRLLSNLRLTLQRRWDLHFKHDHPLYYALVAFPKKRGRV